MLKIGLASVRGRLAKRQAAGGRRGTIPAGEPKIQKIGVRHGVLGPCALGANLNLFALSVEGVSSLRSVSAAGLVSRHRSEFGTLEHSRFCTVPGRSSSNLWGSKVLAKSLKGASEPATAQKLAVSSHSQASEVASRPLADCKIAS